MLKIIIILFIYVCLSNCTKPEVLKLNPITKLNQNSSFPLSCVSLSGSKPLKFEWFKNNQRIPKDSPLINEIENSYSVLNLKNILPDDAGEYSCFVKNSYGSDSTITVLQIQGLFIFEIFKFSFNL